MSVSGAAPSEALESLRLGGAVSMPEEDLSLARRRAREEIAVKKSR
jgi:hypothetical protein